MKLGLFQLKLGLSKLKLGLFKLNARKGPVSKLIILGADCMKESKQASQHLPICIKLATEVLTFIQIMPLRVTYAVAVYYL